MAITPLLPALLLLPAALLLFSAPPAPRPPAAPCRDARAVPPSSTAQLNARLAALVTHSTFFSVFSVSLDAACPFWRDDAAQCVIRECTVHGCRAEDVPPAWRAACAPGSAARRDGDGDDALNAVDRSRTGLAALVAAPPWQAADAASWTPRDAGDPVFVDLRSNPEQYTGYAGAGAARVWQAVYDENCFTFSDKCRSGICDPDACKEERVLYRLISGLHASITMHIARRYLRDGRWGPNLDIYRQRLRPFPERLANLHVAYAVVLRAVSKAAPALHPANYSYVTGNQHNDQFTRQTLDTLFHMPLLRPPCDRPVFDESDMFIQNNRFLLPEFRTAFRNISMIMDCVGCEKCRLWGKLQFLGLATALRILFEDPTPDLERNDLIALINLLYKLSTSVVWADKMEHMVRRDARIMAKAGGFLLGFLLLVLSYLYRPPHQPPAKPKHPPAPPTNKPRDTNSEVSTATVATTTTTTNTTTATTTPTTASKSNPPASTDTSPPQPRQRHTEPRRSERLRKRSTASSP